MNNRIFAIGDIHGCFNAMKELIENKIQLRKEDKLIFLGDYIDRGPDSKLVLDYIIELQNNRYDIITLRGNHESMLVDAWQDESAKYLWLQNGGNETLRSFGADSVKSIDLKYIDFLLSLKWYYAIDKYLFVHAGFNDNIDNPFSDNYCMIWYSREEYLHPLFNDRIVIHGHSPVPLFFTQKQITNSSKVINIDGGYVYSNARYGKLLAIEVNKRSILIAE